VTRVGLDRHSSLVQGLEPQRAYEVWVTAEFPYCESNGSERVLFSTCTSPAKVVEVGAEVVSIDMPPILDPDRLLASSGVKTAFRVEGLTSVGEWDTIYKGEERTMLLRGLPANMLNIIRARCSLDLRGWQRYGDGPLLQLPGAWLGEGGVDAPEEGPPSQDVGSTGSVTGKRSRRDKDLSIQAIDRVHTFYWDLTPVTEVITAPGSVVFDGNATDYNAISSHEQPQHRLDLFWDSPRGIHSSVKLPRVLYALEVYDASRQEYARVYTGPDSHCDLASIPNLPPAIRPQPGVCLHCRVARELEKHSSVYSEGVSAFLSPLPPSCEWTDESRSSVRIRWPASLDLSRLPAGASPMPFHNVLEVASGPLLAYGQGGCAVENKHPLVDYEELARAPAAHEMHSGPLSPGMRYAFRLRCETCHGSSCSTPHIVQTRPTAPSPPSVPKANAASFRSATGSISPFVQIKWKAPNHNGLPVDRYLLQTRRPAGRAPSGEQEWTSWKDIYLGPHLICGDSETLGCRSVKIQYRVRAGSQLGWSGWSAILTVKGQLEHDALADEPTLTKSPSKRSASSKNLFPTSPVPGTPTGPPDQPPPNPEVVGEDVGSDKVGSEVASGAPEGGEDEMERHVVFDQGQDEVGAGENWSVGGPSIMSSEYDDTESEDEFEDIMPEMTVAVQARGQRAMARRMTVRASISLSGNLLSVEGASVGGVGGGPQQLKLSADQLFSFGVEGLLDKDKSADEREKLFQKLYEKLEVDESGMLTCTVMEKDNQPPMPADQVILCTRQPLTFFLGLPSGIRYFVRLSDYGRPGCELEGLENRRKEIKRLSLSASQLDALGCQGMWRAPEEQRVDMFRRLCTKLEVDQDTGDMFIPNLPAEKLVLPPLEKSRSPTSTPREMVSVFWNPVVSEATNIQGKALLVWMNRASSRKEGRGREWGQKEVHQVARSPGREAAFSYLHYALLTNGLDRLPRWRPEWVGRDARRWG